MKIVSSSKNFVKHLDSATVLELNKKIREAGYGKCIEIAAWLNDSGYQATKSAVHRYAVKLKNSDGVTATSGSFEAIIAASGDGGPNTESLTSLYEQLGKLEFHKAQLLQKILTLTS